MGGSGGGGSAGSWNPELQRKIDDLKKKEEERLDSDINNLIDELLAYYNKRNIKDTAKKIEALQSLLRDDIKVDQILFGGSVAKHTEVDGLSDIDALVILNRADLKGKSPRELLNAFYKLLDENLPSSQVQEVIKGTFAVTVKYNNGTEIQLLPALRSGNTISIAAADGKKWSDTNPKVFQRALTRANSKVNNSLVPSIKLFKSINADFPKDKQLTGYHIEAMAVDAVKNYNGSKTPRAVLIHLLDHATNRVINPITDKTGQTRTVDAYLGKANSDKRKKISQILLGFKRRLESATSVSQWRAVFKPEG